MSRPPAPVVAWGCWVLIGGAVLAISAGTPFGVVFAYVFMGVSGVGWISLLTWAYLTDRKDRP